MTIDISKGVYLTTKEIIDYADKHNLDATDVWKKVIDKLVELGAMEYEGGEGSLNNYSEDWMDYKYLRIQEDRDTYHTDDIDYFGGYPVQISIELVYASEGTPKGATKVIAESAKEDTPFQLEVGKIYKSGHSFVKIIIEVDGLTFKPFVGVKCTEDGYPLAYVGLYDVHGNPDSDNNKECGHYLEPIPKEHPNVTKIKELEEQINKLKEEMK